MKLHLVFCINVSLLISLCNCASQTDHEREAWGKDVEYSKDGAFGETVEAKKKRELAESSWKKKWGSPENQRLLLLRNIQEDLSLLGYSVGNTEGFQDNQTNNAIRDFKKKHKIDSPEINEKLEERIHQEAWYVRRADLAQQDIALKRNISNRQLAVCNQLIEKKKNTEKLYGSILKHQSKARVYLYRADGESQQYPKSRLFVNNKKVSDLDTNTFTVLHLDEGQYLFEEKVGFSTGLFGSVYNAPAKLLIEASKTYYIKLVTNASNDPKYGGSGPIIPVFVGDITLFVGGGSPKFYTSSFLLQDQELGECFMTGSRYMEAS